jgi:hypothetical protein
MSFGCFDFNMVCSMLLLQWAAWWSAVHPPVDRAMISAPLLNSALTFDASFAKMAVIRGETVDDELCAGSLVAPGPCLGGAGISSHNVEAIEKDLDNEEVGGGSGLVLTSGNGSLLLCSGYSEAVEFRRVKLSSASCCRVSF